MSRHAVQHGESTIVSQAAELRVIAAIGTDHVGKNKTNPSNQVYHGKQSLSIANLRKAKRKQRGR